MDEMNYHLLGLETSKRYIEQIREQNAIIEELRDAIKKRDEQLEDIRVLLKEALRI